MKTLPRRSTFRARVGGIGIAAILVGLVSLTGVAQAHTDDSGTSSVSPQVACGVRVYMTASGATAGDATNDTDTKTSLETGTSLCITKGVNYYDLSTVAGNVTISNYDVLYVQGQNNWFSSDLSQFGSTDLAVISDFLTAGGGVVIGEWLAWDACAQNRAGAWGDLDTLLPVTIRTGCAYGSNKKVRFYRWDRPLSPLIDTGVAADFVFQPADYAGSLSFLNLKTGATPYYWATWDSNVANIPPATDPANLPSAGGVGMAGWVPAGKTGRVFAFATTNGAPELTDTTSANSFRRLLVNALGWAGSVGGSINPDAVTVTVSGGVVNTPALTPSRITGAVTYSIVNGTLPSGLTLNPSTGAITGTSTQNGTFTVTIQGVGSTSGSAQAIVSLQVSGVAVSTTSTTTSLAASPTTTALSSSTTASPSNSAGATRVSSGSKLPTAGSSVLFITWIALALLALGGVLFAGYRRRAL